MTDERRQRLQGRTPALPGGCRELRLVGVLREPLVQRQDDRRRLGSGRLGEAPGHRIGAEIAVEILQALLDGLEDRLGDRIVERASRVWIDAQAPVRELGVDLRSVEAQERVAALRTAIRDVPLDDAGRRQALER